MRHFVMTRVVAWKGSILRFPRIFLPKKDYSYNTLTRISTLVASRSHLTSILREVLVAIFGVLFVVIESYYNVRAELWVFDRLRYIKLQC